MNRTIKSIAVGATTLIAAIGIASVSAGSATAADPDETFPIPLINGVQYDVTGSAHVQNKNAKFDVPLGPTKITADTGFNNTEDGIVHYYAALPLPPKTVSFKAFGYLPVTAKVSFTQVGPATGEVRLGTAADGNDELNGTAQYVVSLSDVIVGYSKANVGSNCQTRYPITVTFASTKYVLQDGGDLAGSFDLGKFNNCSTSTDLANLIVPSNGNTVKLHLSNFATPDSNSAGMRQVRKLEAKK